MAANRCNLSRVIRVLAITAGVCLCMSLSSAVRAESDAVYHSTAVEYEAAVKRALRAFDREDWPTARQYFQRAHELLPNAQTHKALGQVAYEVNDFAEATDQLRAALSDRNKPLTDTQRREVEGWLGQAERQVARVRIAVDPPDAELRVDGHAVALDTEGALTLAPGLHEVQATAPHFSIATRVIQAHPGLRTSVQLALSAEARPDDGPSTMRVASYSAFGVALAAGVGVAAVWFTGQGRVKAVDDQCRPIGPSCDYDGKYREAGVQTFETWTNVLWAVAGAAVLSGGLLFALEPGEGQRTEPRVALAAGPGGLTVAARF